MTFHSNMGKINMDNKEEVTSFAVVVEHLKDIHKAKSASYGDSWRKRGELVSVFGNVARKFDRLENYASDLDKWQKALKGEESETLADTVMDLAVYAILWCVHIEQTRNQQFKDAYYKATGVRDGNEVRSK